LCVISGVVVFCCLGGGVREVVYIDVRVGKERSADALTSYYVSYRSCPDDMPCRLQDVTSWLFVSNTATQDLPSMPGLEDIDIFNVTTTARLL